MAKNYTVPVAAAVAATAAVGSVASADTDSRWYRRLRKPSFQPPAKAFPVAWTSLYASIAWAVPRGLRATAPAERPALARTTGTNLVLNAGWSWAFFKAHRLGLSTVWAGLLALSSWRLARRTGRADAAAGWALVPYGLWTTFATILTGRIWLLNQDKRKK